MEHKSLWKNFLLLTVGSLIVLHMNIASAAGQTSTSTSSTDDEKTEGCVLTE